MKLLSSCSATPRLLRKYWPLFDNVAYIEKQPKTQMLYLAFNCFINRFILVMLKLHFSPRLRY